MDLLHIRNYHNNLLKSLKDLDKNSLICTNYNAEVDVYFINKLHL